MLALLVENVPKGSCVKRCVSLLWLLPVLCAVPPAEADQSSPDKFAGQVTTDTKTGRVGIGTTTPQATLDIYQGEIKIGSTGAACTAELAGTMRSGKSHLQFCDGAGWQNVSLDRAQ
jgi:hypothetical protein